MSLKGIFSRIMKKAPEEPVPSTPAKPAAVTSTEPIPDATPAPASQSVPGTPVAPAGKKGAGELDDAVKMLREITKALETADRPQDVVMAKLPCKVVLCKLPEENRGVQWNAEQFPDATIEVPRQSLLEQLRLGVITFPLSDFVDSIPAAWIKATDSDMMVEFDLETVVTAIPPEWMTLSVGVSDLAIEASQMHDYFAPQAAASAEPEAAASVPEPITPSVPEPSPAAPVVALQPVEPPVVPPEPVVTVEPPAEATPMPVTLAPSEPVPVVPRPVQSPPMAATAEEPAAPAVAATPEPLPVLPPVPALSAPVAAPAPLVVPTPVAAEITPVQLPDKEPEPLPEQPEPVPAAVVIPAAPQPIIAPPAVPSAPVPDAPHVPTVTKPGPVSVHVPEPARHVPDGGIDGWDGIESGIDAAAHAININTADAEALQTLPAVGPTVAAAIVADRQAHGPFRGVFDLTRVAGIGYRQFVKMTGLDPKVRNNRHATLNAILGLPAHARPSLATIFEHAASVLGVHGCLLSNHDGMPLAYTPQLAERSSDYAALVPQFFRRTDKYLRTLTVDSIHCVIIPISDPPLLLLSGDDMYLIFLLTHKAPSELEVERIITFGRELNWLLSYRAVVRA